MAVRRVEGGSEGRGRGRRMDWIFVLLFALMLAVGLAVFPLSVAANRLSGLWITLCASLGIG